MIIQSANEISKVLQWLEGKKLVTHDIESTGLKVRKDKVIGFGCACPATLTAFYIITHAWKNGELVELIAKEQVLPVLKALQTKQLIGFNYSFDSRICYHYYEIDLAPSLYADVMLMAHTLDENKMQYGLKPLAISEFGYGVATEQKDMLASIKANGGSDKEYYKADPLLMAKYGIQDNLLTARLFNRYMQQLKLQGLEQFFFNNEVMPLYRLVTIPMERKGIAVNIENLKQQSAEISRALANLEAEIQSDIKPLLAFFEGWYLEKEFPLKLTGPFVQKFAELENVELPKLASGKFTFAEKGINKLPNCRFKRVFKGEQRLDAATIRQVQLELFKDTHDRYMFNLLSPDHLKRLFFGYGKTESVLKETPLSTTEKGNPQVDDEFLQQMAAKYKWAAKMQDYRSLNKLAGTYIDRILDEQEDGVFYPQFHQHRTTSGRYSGDMQQLPRKKDEEDLPSPLVRHFNNKVRDFIVSKPGWKLIDADYSSLEVVVFADDAGDDALLDIIRNDYDPYSQVAIQVKKLIDYSADKKAPNFLKKHLPSVRQNAKAYTLGIRYGLGAFKLSKDLNISEQEANQIVSDYFKSFPKLKQRMDAIIKSAKQTGIVKSALGRVRRLPELRELYAAYGEDLIDPLRCWQRWHGSPVYGEMKRKARIARNLINNALNFPIQSMAASIVTRASIAIAREFAAKGLEAYICLSVHDELCAHAPDNEVTIVKEIMQRCMEQTTKLSVPLQAEPMVSDKYGDLK